MNRTTSNPKLPWFLHLSFSNPSYTLPHSILPLPPSSPTITTAKWDTMLLIHPLSIAIFSLLSCSHFNLPPSTLSTLKSRRAPPLQLPIPRSQRWSHPRARYFPFSRTRHSANTPLSSKHGDAPVAVFLPLL